MKIAILASECAPYCKSGGLGDVMEALPAALAKFKGNQVALFLPYYEKVKYDHRFTTTYVTHFQVGVGWRNVYCGIMKLEGRNDGVQVYFIDNDRYFGARPGSIYGHGDDGERFAFFSKACLDAMAVMDWIPDVIHCNDWQTALVPTYVKAMYRHLFPHTRCVFTIHNVEYQGWASPDFFDDVLYLPWEWRGCMDMNGAVNMMKGAIESADLITTVSENYARELMFPYFAHGLDSVLSNASWKLTGITNGIDIHTVNPKTDPNLPCNYDVKNFVEGKAKCKAALQAELGLPQRADVPLCVMVTRLAEHKGLDLLCYIVRRLLWEEDVQLAVLGTGEPHYEEFLHRLAEEFPDKVAAKITFHSELASRIYAGGDIYLMPSKTEPCGLSQMNAMRYGTVPVVHATGGLRDTVPPVEEHGRGGLGFTFQSYNGDDFYASLKRALDLYRHQKDAFHALQERDMRQDFSWRRPAKRYMDLFRQILEA